MNERCRIAIVGGGAAGLAAAIFAAEAWDRPDGEASHAPRPPRPAILLLDGARKLGAKILVSGGGRCNVTNETVRAEDFHASSLPFVRQVLAGFDVPATIAWFASLGVELQREEAGKLFPVSQRAATVLEALLARCEALGVSIRTGCRIEEIVPMQRADGEGVRTTAPRFAVRHAGGEIEAHAAILATGGRSLPRTGSDGLGLAIARSLGHTVTPTHPALVPLVLDRSFFHGRLSGLSQVVRLTVLSAGRRIEEREGGLLWTHFGVSGPVVLDASHAWGAAQVRGEEPGIRVSLLREPFEAAERWLLACAREAPRRSIGRVVGERLAERLAGALCEHAGIDPSTPLAQLGRDARRRLAHALSELALPVERTRGWDFAEVTAGGVDLAEIDPRTMESRVQPGCYLAGEMLDVDGRIGGFNFQWAWSSGRRAGVAAAAAVRFREDGERPI